MAVACHAASGQTDARVHGPSDTLTNQSGAFQLVFNPTLVPALEVHPRLSSSAGILELDIRSSGPRLVELLSSDDLLVWTLLRTLCVTNTVTIDVPVTPSDTGRQFLKARGGD